MITWDKEGNRYWWTAADGKQLCFNLKQGKWETPDGNKIPFNAEVATLPGDKERSSTQSAGRFDLQITYWTKSVNVTIVQVDYCTDYFDNESGWEEETLHRIAKYPKEQFAALNKSDVIASAYEYFKREFGHLVKVRDS